MLRKSQPVTMAQVKQRLAKSKQLAEIKAPASPIVQVENPNEMLAQYFNKHQHKLSLYFLIALCSFRLHGSRAYLKNKLIDIITKGLLQEEKSENLPKKSIQDGVQVFLENNTITDEDLIFCISHLMRKLSVRDNHSLQYYCRLLGFVLEEISSKPNKKQENEEAVNLLNLFLEVVKGKDIKKFLHFDPCQQGFNPAGLSFQEKKFLSALSISLCLTEMQNSFAHENRIDISENKMMLFAGVCFFAMLVALGAGLFNKPIEMAGEFNHYLHEKYGAERGRLLSIGSFGGLFLLWCATFYYALHKTGRKEYRQLIEADVHHTENNFKNSIELVFKVGVVIADLIEASSPLSKEKVDGFMPSSPVVPQQNAPKKQKLNVKFDFVVDNSGKQKTSEEKSNDFDISLATSPSFWQSRRSVSSDEQKVPEFQHINFGCWGTWDEYWHWGCDQSCLENGGCITAACCASVA